MRIAVLGAGLAGLSAACELCDLGHEVVVFEKRPFAGGKTYSHIDRETGEAVDNGQHVFMACTTAYTDFLRKLGTLGLARRQKRLKVRVFDGDGRESKLWAQRLPAPLHLGISFARYRHLAWADKVRVGRLLLQVFRMRENERRALAHVPFDLWLRGHGQADAVIATFWDFMLVPTLNCRSEAASTADALFVLREGFLKSSRSAAIGVAAAGLSELHVDPAIRYIEQHGGEVRTKAGITSIRTEDGAVTAVETADGSVEQFDGVVCALPHEEVAGILPMEFAAQAPFAGLASIPTAPIINLHLWFDRPVAEFSFAAFIGSELQWVFNRERIERNAKAGDHHLVVSLSAAEPYMELSKQQLQERFLPQLRAALPAARAAELLKFVAIKEPRATFVPAPGLERPGPLTPIRNFALAGAYTATGWPATMESAVRSGTAAGQALHATFRPSWQTAVER
jgi:squalene-associated FAD-dependent desaturase